MRLAMQLQNELYSEPHGGGELGDNRAVDRRE